MGAYSEDLERIARTKHASAEDLARVERLATHLARLHRETRSAPDVWAHAVRDLFGGDAGLAGVLDRYDGDPAAASPEARRVIEHWGVDWRHRLKRIPERLRRIHGAFAPETVSFTDDTIAADAPPCWGEAAEDLSAMAAGYLCFSLRAAHGETSPFRKMFRALFESYLTETEDLEVLRVIAPYFVRRALALGAVSEAPRVRARLFEVVATVMRHDAVDLEDLDALFHA